MLRWEHRTVKGIIDYSLDEELHKMEVLGWELVSAVGFKNKGYSNHYTLFFKRQMDAD